MIGLMSLWTGAAGFRMTRGTALIASMAVASLPKVFESSEFVCDKKGLEIAERLGWQFTGLQVALNDFCAPQERHIWMLGKIHASSIQTEPHCHVDLDLIVQKFPDRVMGARCAVQGEDQPEAYRSSRVRRLMRACGVTGAEKKFNTAITLWNDLAARDAYCASAKLASSILSKIERDGTIASIVAEQAVLGQVASECGFAPECCIPIPSLARPRHFKDVEFVHLWGQSKHTHKWVAKVEDKFEAEYPENYSQFLAGLVTLQRKGIIQ